MTRRPPQGIDWRKRAVDDAPPNPGPEDEKAAREAREVRDEAAAERRREERDGL